VIKNFLATMIFLGLSQFALAQSQCSNVLIQARDEFDAGHLNGIASLLNDCLNQGFTKEQKVEAYRLLTITYLYLDDPFGAEQSFLGLLEIEPEYRILPTDPVELEYLSNRFITTPIISYFGKIGTNFSTATVLHHYSTGNSNDKNWMYNSKIGITASGALELHFNKVISMVAEVEFSRRKYSYSDILLPGNLDNSHDQVDDRTNFHTSLPVGIKFTYPGLVYYPYVYGGYSPSFTLSSKADLQRKPQKEALVEVSSENLIHLTPNFSHSLIFGIGLKRRFDLHYIFVDLRYRLGMTNMLDTSNEFDFNIEEIRNVIFKYDLATDDYRWNSFELTVGYVWPKYKPRPKNSVTIQTVMKKWFTKKNKSNE